jgi:Plavaka transposase
LKISRTAKPFLNLIWETPGDIQMYNFPIFSYFFLQNFMWRLPYVNIYEIIGSDVLHQLDKGVFQHMLNWLKKLIVEKYPNKLEANSQFELINNRIKSIPPYPGLRRFNNGIFLANSTATENRTIQKVSNSDLAEQHHDTASASASA